MSQKIYLASNSPRRWELLQNLGLSLEKLPSDIDESPLAHELAYDYCLRIAKEKNQHAQAVRIAQNFANFPILTADTTVSINGNILGKPKNREDAFAMLQQLSGNTHQVFTAVCVSFNGEQFSLVQQSDVTFRPLAESEICAYIDSGEPLDKAGAYGIQKLGGMFVQHLSGSFTGVMGLPIFETCELLKKVGVQIL